MAHITRIWNLQYLGFARRHEMEGMASDILVRNRLLDLGHMAGDTLIARAIRLVMGMRFDAGRMRAGLRVRAVAIEAERIAGFTHHGDVVPAMGIVARKAGDAAGIHQTLHEIVALHAVFVRGDRKSVV